MSTLEKPEALTEEHLTYLDELRESGQTNMWGADAYLQAEFKLDRHTASLVLAYWMQTFTERHR